MRPSDALTKGGRVVAGTDAATPQQSEADFRFSNLKRKWHAEEGKYLSNELRRAQDLTVQQEMELEALRQQLASFTSGTPQACLCYPGSLKYLTRSSMCHWAITAGSGLS